MEEEKIGEKIGSWTILYPGPRKKGGKTFFCQCKCKKIVLQYACNLFSNKTKHCIACARKNQKNYHGMSKSSTYSVYIQMIERCHNEKHPCYDYYGSRGVYVCEDWRKDFKNFLSDMGEKPKGLSIDRIDNDKGYFKNNCKWSTKKEQQRNRRISIKLGDIVNGWLVINRLENKTYKIKCLYCLYERTIRSCNLRRVKSCKHKKGNNYGK